MAIGVSDTEEATVREQLQGTFAQYLDANGSLDADGVGSILYVAEALNVDNNSKLIVDSKRSFTTYANDSAQKATGAYGDKIDNNDVYIGENSALALGEAAALTATYNNAPRAALDFDKNGASLYAEKNAKILLVGSDFSIHSDIHLFSDNDGNGIMINGNNGQPLSNLAEHYDTFVKGLPEFFRWYDVRFDPQNTILEPDYLVLKDISGYTGIDKICEFIQSVCLEQKFLSEFPVDYITNILSAHNCCWKESAPG